MNDQLVRAFKFHYWQENVVGGGLLPQIYPWWITVDHDTKRSQKRSTQHIPKPEGTSFVLWVACTWGLHQPWASPAARKCPGGIRLRIWSILEDVKQHHETTVRTDKKTWEIWLKFPWYQAGYQVYSLNKLPILILGNHLRESNEGSILGGCGWCLSRKQQLQAAIMNATSTRLKITEKWFCL